MRKIADRCLRLSSERSSTWGPDWIWRAGGFVRKNGPRFRGRFSSGRREPWVHWNPGSLVYGDRLHLRRLFSVPIDFVREGGNSGTM